MNEQQTRKRKTNTNSIFLVNSKNSNRNSRARKYLWLMKFSPLVAAVLTMMIALPFIGVFPYMLMSPLIWIWPELGSTGELVEIGFLWVVVKKTWLWPVFFLYLFALTCLLILAASLFERFYRGLKVFVLRTRRS